MFCFEGQENLPCQEYRSTLIQTKARTGNCQKTV